MQHLPTIAYAAWTSTILVHIPALKIPSPMLLLLSMLLCFMLQKLLNVIPTVTLNYSTVSTTISLSVSNVCMTVYYSCVSFCSVNPEAQNVVTDAPTLKSTYLQHLSTQKTPQTQPTITLIPSSTLTSTIKPVVTDAPSTTSYPPSVASTAKTTAPHHATGRSTILAWVTLPRRVNKH